MEGTKIQLKNIKSYLSGKNPIKETPKGFRYKFYQIKKRYKTTKAFCGQGKAFFFYDFGSYGSLNYLKYSSVNNGFQKDRTETIWFRIKNNKLQISKGTGTAKRIISNNPSKIGLYFDERVLNSFRPILIKWLKRNGIKIKKSYYSKKLPFQTFLLFVCYPEFEYLNDFINIPRRDSSSGLMGLDSEITKRLKDAKGINHILDRVFGFHGKKLKKYLNSCCALSNVYDCFLTGIVFKNLVTNDDIQRIIENFRLYDINVGYSGSGIKILRYFFKNYNRETLLNWVFGPDTRQIWDTALQYYHNHKENPNNKMVLPDSNNIEDIHNIVTGNFRRLAVVQEKIDYKDTLKRFDSLNGLVVNDLTIIVPQSSDEIISYSNDLGNCLSGYVSWHGKNGVILGVFQDNKIKYAISVNNSKAIEQFYGKHNRLPELRDYDLVLGKLKELKFVESSNMDGYMHKPAIEMGIF